ALQRSRIARSVWRYVEPGIAHIDPAEEGTARIVVDSYIFLVVENRRIHIAGRIVEIRCGDRCLSSRCPSFSIVQRLEDMDFRERLGAEEAELTHIECMFASAVGAGWITASAEVTVSGELRRDACALPMLPAIACPHDDDAAAHVVIGSADSDKLIIRACRNRFLVLRQSGETVVIHLDVGRADACRCCYPSGVPALGSLHRRVEAESNTI